jgi:DNA-binding LytR/AlgR family response regulator
MILRIEEIPSQKDIEVIITFPKKNEITERIVSFMKTVDTQIECNGNNIIKMINVSDIYYIESLEKATVVFCENENYQTRYRLYQLNEKLSDKGFVQISKYCILNMNKLECFKSLLNSRMEVLLTNGACLYVNRNYLANLKERLKK